MYNPSKDAGVCPLGTEKYDSHFSTLVSGLYLRSRNLCEQIYWSVRYSEKSITSLLHLKERTHCGQ